MATPPKKPAARRTGTRKTAGTGRAAGAADTAASKATGAAGAVKAAATRKTAAPRATTAKPATQRKATTARKPRSTGTGTSAAQVAAAVKSAPHNLAEKAQATAKRAKDKSPVGIKTAIAAGLGAVGAVATAALLTLRGSSAKQEPERLPPPEDTKPASKARKAKQADGTDSSKSFEAGIADEGSIPHN